MKIKVRKITELKPSEYNPRVCSLDERLEINASLKSFGFVQPAIINCNPKRKDIIIGGHRRIEEWGALGHTHVPCIELNLTLKQEKELNIRLNHAQASFDFEKLQTEFQLDDLLEWGFTEQELNFTNDTEMETVSFQKNNNPKLSLKIEFKTKKELQKWMSKLSDEGLNVKIVK